MSSSRTSKIGGHILISGTGRAGTTLLVKYFTVLGFDTGFPSDATTLGTNTGLELVEEPRPYIIKSPLYATSIGSLLDRGALAIKCCIVPVRRLSDAAESRRRVYQEALPVGGQQYAMDQPGSITTNDPNNQETVLALGFYGLIEALVRHRVPLHFLYFPAFAESADELYMGLRSIFDEHGVSRNESDLAHRLVTDLRLVHRF